jgi:hypothetical protein
MSVQVDYSAPKRFNAVTITMLLILAGVGYWIWRFFPFYFDGFTVDHILKETASAVYKANRQSEPGRTETLKELVEKAKLDIQTKANVTDPQLVVGLEIEGVHAWMTADYRAIVTHPGISQTTVLHFQKKEDANIKAVNWD